MKVLKVIKENLEPIILRLGFNVWDILFEKEGSSKFLRVYIFKNDGSNITLDDCELVSNELSKKLDELDIVQERYYLEVSSVGLERKLIKEKHFLNSVGSSIHLKFKKSFEGKKNLKGILKGLKDGKIMVETKDEIYYIPIKNCSYVKLEDGIKSLIY